MDNYQPKPLDVDGVNLPEEVALLAEELSENTHEVWAQGKMEEGWTYGEKLDTAKKTHPSLVPYCELSEAQKDYDRRTSLGALKFVLAKGFKIVKE